MTASLNEAQRSEYCRRKGLYPGRTARWRDSAVAGNEAPGSLTKAERRALQKDRKTIRRLEKELNRKDKALAEAAALLVLQKKVRALWGEAEDE